MKYVCNIYNIINFSAIDLLIKKSINLFKDKLVILFKDFNMKQVFNLTYKLIKQKKKTYNMRTEGQVWTMKF